jgi:MobA/MobL family protein
MANYFLHVKTFSRGNGSRVTKAAAYRAGERIRDERTSAVYNYTARTDVAHAEIVLPSEYAGRVDMEWALDRSRLWNAAEHAGRLRNSRLGREILVHVPPEMTPAQRTHLVRSFSRELADRYRNAVDFAVHEPRAHADHRHHHAHLLMTTREVGPNGLGARTTLDLSGTERHARGLGQSKDELLWMRERWAEVTNEALRTAGISARVDHRSYKDQGVDREPQPLIPRAIVYSERASGKSNPAGDDIRARHRERVEARLKGSEELARVIARQRAENRQRAIQSAERREANRKIPQGALTREERNQKRREWCKANAEEVNRKQRERRRANADEVNRKQRDYYLKRRAEQDSARRSSKLRQQQQADTRPTQTLDPAGKDASARGRPRPSPNAEDSVNNWLAYRENQKRAESSRSASQDGSRDRSVRETDQRDTEEAGKDTNRGRNNDAAL